MRVPCLRKGREDSQLLWYIRSEILPSQESNPPRTYSTQCPQPFIFRRYRRRHCISEQRQDPVLVYLFQYSLGDGKVASFGGMKGSSSNIKGATYQFVRESCSEAPCDNRSAVNDARSVSSCTWRNLFRHAVKNPVRKWAGTWSEAAGNFKDSEKQSERWRKFNNNINTKNILKEQKVKLTYHSCPWRLRIPTLANLFRPYIWLPQAIAELSSSLVYDQQASMSSNSETLFLQKPPSTPLTSYHDFDHPLIQCAHSLQEQLQVLGQNQLRYQKWRPLQRVINSQHMCWGKTSFRCMMSTRLPRVMHSQSMEEQNGEEWHSTRFKTRSIQIKFDMEWKAN